MLRSFLFYIVFCLSASNSMGSLFSQLDLRMFDDGQFTVLVDNQPYNTPSNRFNINNLLPGNHFLQVKKTLSYSGHYDNYGNTYFYSGLISIPYNVSVQAFIDSYRSFNVISIRPLEFINNPLEYNNSITNNPINNIFERKFNLQDSSSYIELLNYVKSQGPSKMRLMVLKRSIIPNKITTSQVRELMKLLDFDVERLEFARFAYYFTADRHNYFQIKKSFIFPSTANDLSNHLFEYD